MTRTDYADTLFLSSTDFPMRAGLPAKEVNILEYWKGIALEGRQKEICLGRVPYVLHDGPPYANGHLHIGHALNKILKDIIVRSMRMQGHEANYVPGWDCHGLPIEWKVEEQYRAEGRDKDSVPINEFRGQCREFATHWMNIQSAEFKRLGVTGSGEEFYTTMDYAAEAQIARELMKFAVSGQLYRGSKPVLWSVVERTALAEAEIEYAEHQSDVIWVSFPIRGGGDQSGLDRAEIIIWTTTPWTIPANRAICFSSEISYGLYRVEKPAKGGLVQSGRLFVIADALVSDVMRRACIEGYDRVQDVTSKQLSGLSCTHPLRELGYEFEVPLLDGAHVTAESGTGFVHTAPGHGSDDFDVWVANRNLLEQRGIETAIPQTVDADGILTREAPGFSGRRVMTAEGSTGDANGAVIKSLEEAGRLIASGRLKHSFPHSWRSRKPVIFRNTPQWFIAMDKVLDDGTTLRLRALKSIDETHFIPENGRNRLRGMIESRPDWVISRQRVWGVPITLFVNKETGQLLCDPSVNERIVSIFEVEGSDSWFEDTAKARFLGSDYNPEEWEKVDDILDVWFDSGATHAFVLEKRSDLKWPADLYLEGSDQHRGWFQSSLLESCGTRGTAPYRGVLTHGFVLAGDGRKMSKSLGNQVIPGQVVEKYGADILRLWVVGVDYVDDVRISDDILKSTADLYRRLRNVMRFLLSNLSGFTEAEIVSINQMPELERWVLHRLWELDAFVRESYREFAHQRLFSTLFNFLTLDLSATYFDIRKDSLYCDSITDLRRRACRTVLDHLFHCLVRWFAPVLCFTMDEVWLTRFSDRGESVHLYSFKEIPTDWQDDVLAAKFRDLRSLRRLITGAIEIERAAKTLGSSLEAKPVLYLSDANLLSLMEGVDMAELCITSGLELSAFDKVPDGAFRADDILPRAAVVIEPASGVKCARCWKVMPEVGRIPEYTNLCSRCADVVGGLCGKA